MNNSEKAHCLSADPGSSKQQDHWREAKLGLPVGLPESVTSGFPRGCSVLPKKTIKEH